VLIIASTLIFVYNIVRTVYDRSWVPRHVPESAPLPVPTVRDPQPQGPNLPPAPATD
jgi:hypothetical protein